MTIVERWLGLFLGLAVAGVLGAADGELRVWRDAGGKLEMKAALVKVEGQNVQIRRDDGRVFQVPLAKFSAADGAYAAEFAAKAANVRPAGQPRPVGKPRPAAADVIVIVRQQVGERHILLPGIVFSTAGDKTYIAAEDPHLLENPDLDVKRIGQATIVWGAAGEHNGIPAKRLGLLVKRQKWIYEAAADKLPRPLPAPKPAEKAIGPVSLVGFTLFPEEFTPLASTGSCQRTRDTTLNRDELRVQISTKPGFSGVLLISEKLGPVGFGLFPGITYDGLTLIAHPLEELAALTEPEVVHIAVAPVGGDAKSIAYEFVVAIADPFQNANKPRLAVKSAGGTLDNGFGQRGPDGQPTKAPEQVTGGTSLPLAYKAMSPVAANQIPLPGMIGVDVPWVATLTTANPGDRSVHDFWAQVYYTDRAGKEIAGPVQKVVWPGAAPVYAIDPKFIPAIPGLNGKLDVSRTAPSR